MAKEEKLLAALLNANQELVEVFRCYHELEVAANAEEEKTGHNRGREGDISDVCFGHGVPIHLTTL